MLISIPKEWGRTLVYGTGWPAWEFAVLDANKQPVSGYAAEFVVKRSPADTHVLKTISTGAGLSKTGAVSIFDSIVDIKVQEVVIGGWFQVTGGKKIPILYDYFKIIQNTTPNA